MGAGCAGVHGGGGGRGPRGSSLVERKEEECWQPPKKIEELFNATAGNTWASINSPTAGARNQNELPRGKTTSHIYS